MTERLLVFSDTEYESRWKKVELEMISRGLETAVIGVEQLLLLIEQRMLYS